MKDQDKYDEAFDTTFLLVVFILSGSVLVTLLYGQFSNLHFPSVIIGMLAVSVLSSFACIVAKLYR